MPYAQQVAALSPRGPGTAAPESAAQDAAPPGAEPVAVDHPILRQGSNGDAVRECQRKLNLHGAELIEDGMFGPRTAAAVRTFQADQGLSADGVVGPLTWGALDQGLQATPAKADTPAGTAVPVQQLAPPGTSNLVPGTGGGRPEPGLTNAQTQKELDDLDLIPKFLMTDRSEFAAYMATGVVSPVLAGVLSLMRDLGGELQYGYESAKNGLSDGSILGVIFNSERDTLLQRKLRPADPDRALFAQAQATSKGAAFFDNPDHSRGLVMVGDGHSWSNRAQLVDLAHELNHYVNRGAKEATEADPSHDIADGENLPPQQIAETRSTFVHEVTARHEEWWGAWTIRQERLGGSLADVDPPKPEALFTACVNLAVSFDGDRIYDPYGYWGRLVHRGNDSVERQVGGWLALVKNEVISGNPYRDMMSKAVFEAASHLTTANAQPNGLGSDIDD